MPPESARPSAPRPRRWVVALGVAFLLLAAASMVYLLFVSIPASRAEAVQDWETRLTATVDDRQVAVEQLVADLRADAFTIAQYPTAQYVLSGRTGPPYPFDPDLGPVEHLQDLFSRFVDVNVYQSAALYDTAGERVASDTLSSRAPGPLVLEMISDAVAGSTRVDLAHNGTERMVVAVPVHSRSGNRIGAAMVAADAQRFIYRTLRQEAVPSATGETFLVTEQGGQVVYISPLRKLDAGPGAVRIAMDSTGLAGAAAIRADTGGWYTDYNGDEVLAAIRGIDGTPWTLVAKADAHEVLADFRSDVGRVVAAVVGLLIGAFGLGFGFWWRQRQRLASERLAAERERQKTEERYRALVENLPDLIARFDPDLTCRFASAPVEDRSPFAVDDPAGRGYDELGLPPDAAAALRRALEALFARGQSQELDFSLPGDGEDRSFDCRLVPERGPGGGLASAVAIIRETTAQRELERQLRQAQKMDAVGRLAGGVAHDFNNILTSIQGHAALIRDELESDTSLREDLGEIIRSAERAAALTQQLLAFSRRQVLQPRPVDVGSVVTGMQSMLQRLIGTHIELDVHADDDGSLTILADPSQLEQVVLNLAVNARDAMPDGGRLRIEVFQDDWPSDDLATHPDPADHGPAVFLTVADTGSGMPPEIVDRIFEPFFTTKDEAKGTGLGLSTVYGIVEQSNGRIRVQSEPGHGTRFELCFPLADEPPADAA